MAYNHPPISIEDTKRGLQKELAGLKIKYLSMSSTPERDAKFAELEANLADRFRKIGCAPSYPRGFQTLSEF